MLRLVTIGSFCLTLVISLSGCTSFFTAAAIDSFSEGLAAGNLDRLKDSTTASFQERALRLPGSVASLEALSLPKVAGEIVLVEEISEKEQLVTVEVGEKKQTVQYRLSRNPEAAAKQDRGWKIDDVILTQQRPGQSQPISKSVSEQMNLMLTVQEFLAHWESGSREEILAELHPDLAGKLETLSPTHLAQVTSGALDGVSTDRFRPEVRMQDDRAAVLLPRRNGKLVLNLALAEGSHDRWQVTEIIQQSTRSDTPEQSVAVLADCLSTAARFLMAYGESDRKGLQTVSSKTFYDQALAAGDLSSAPLPTTEMLTTQYELEEQGLRSDLLFDVGGNTYLLSLSRDPEPEVYVPGDAGSDRGYHVDEVTIYEQGGQQIKPLSSLFNAQVVVELFAEALSTRDLTMLTQLSSADLNGRVWQRIEDKSLIRELPIEGVPSAPPKIVTTIFQGPVTEITVTQGTRALTYVLHATRGRPRVHDVLIPSNSRPASLKSMLEAVVPVYNFVWAWEQNRVDVLAKYSTDSMRRMVWVQAGTDVPKINAPLRAHLAGGILDVSEMEGERTVVLGTRERRLEARLRLEGDRLVVEDIHLTGGQTPGARVELVNTMRDWLTRRAGMALPPGKSMSRVTVQSPLAAVQSMVEQSKPSVEQTRGERQTAEATPDDDSRPLLQRPIAIPGL
ncbi:MAG: hypothetical protein R3B90_16260 [Planctomycetaceae bacterium]